MPPLGGPVPPEVTSAFKAGLFEVPAPGEGLRTAATQPVWILPVLLVDFTDQPLTYASWETWNTGLFDTTGVTPTGSVFDYYKWVSGNRIRVVGRVVATVHLSGTKDFYANNNWGLSTLSTPRNTYGAVDEALRYSDATVDWSAFDQDHDGYVDMVWVVHSGLGGESTVARDNLWSITSRLTAWSGGGVFITNDAFPGSVTQKMRIDRFAMLPEISAHHPGGRADIGVFCHEFGHALGLPDLYDTAPLPGAFNVGPGNWSLMSTGVYGGDDSSPEYPTGLGAWPLLFLGWNRTVRPTQDTTLVLGPQERGAAILDLWFQGEQSPDHFLIENRQREGFDRNLPGEGLIIYHLDESALAARVAANRVNSGPNPALRLVEADGQVDLILGLSHGDADDAFPGSLGRTVWDDDTSPSTRSLSGAVTNIALRNIEQVGLDMRFLAQVRALGWRPPENRSGASYSPLLASGPAVRAVIHEDWSISAATCELVGAQRQILLRTRRPDLSWQAPFQVSHSPAAASEPTVAALPGGDLAIVWSDTRHGPSELYFRSRIAGVWTAERRLTDLPGSCTNPSLAADPRGGLHLAWLRTASGTPEVLFLYFPYTSPFGDPMRVTLPKEFPDAPCVTASPDGSSYIFWPDRATTPTLTWFAHFSPDSGVRPRVPVGPQNGTNQPGVTGLMDAWGNLHAVWQVSSAGAGELHYQRWPAEGGQPSPRDTTIEHRPEQVQSPSLWGDPQGGIHIVMEATNSGIPQVRYKHWDPEDGWDVGSTEVTLPGDGIAVRPAVLAVHPGILTVLYTTYPGGQPAFMERRRDLLALTEPTAVESPAAVPWMGLRAAPNPATPGAALRLRWVGAMPPPSDRVEIFDVGGRRLVSLPLRNDGFALSARLSPSETRGWPSGIYFARVPGGSSSARIVILR